MTNFTWLVPLPTIIPLIAAGLTLAAAGHVRAQRAISLTALTSVLGVAVALLLLADRRGPQVMHVGGWEAYEGVVLVIDRLAAIMVIVSVIVTLAVLSYSIGEGRRAADEERDESAPLPVFHPTLLVLSAGVSTTFISGDLFHIYVGFEMLLSASFVLLTLGGTRARVRAGITYVFVSLVSSICFLTAIALLYSATGTVNLALLAQRLDQIPTGTAILLQGLLILGFCIKAAVFPISGWLPDSYPTAPAPVTAVFAGLLTKVGVYALIRAQTLLFPQGRLDTILLVAALLTMIVGILGAIVQDDIKRVLSFTLVSHIGYLVFGIAVGGAVGLSAAIFYVAHHIIIQTALFLVAGLIERAGGSTDVRKLGGLAQRAPLLAFLFFVPAMNLAGIPPFSGFLGKVGLIRAGVQDGSGLALVLVVGCVLTSLLTLYAVARVWQRTFWGEPSPDAHPRPVRAAIAWGVRGPTVALIAVSIAITVAAGPLFGITDRAANDLLQRTPYLNAVLGTPASGGGS